MDVWFVAAAAGAGYVAQCLKDIKSGKSLVSSEGLNLVKSVSPSVLPQLHDKPCSSNGSMPYAENEQTWSDASDTEMVLINKSDGEFLSRAMVSNSNSLDIVLKNEDAGKGWEGRVSADIDESINDSLPQPSSREVGFSYDFRRNRSSIKSRQINKRFTKPRTSLESCLMAQLLKEQAEIDEYACCIHRRSLAAKMRPFLTPDEVLINDKHHKSPDAQIGNYIRAQKNNDVLGLPRLPEMANEDLQKKVKARSRKMHPIRIDDSSKMVNGSHKVGQESSDASLQFFLGLTMGMVSSIVANETKVKRLTELLKHTENLVQDLQEELEMKDSLTVKELTVEDCESPEETSDQNSNEESSLSKIEAELEAELERLESSMNPSVLEGNTSNATEPYNPDVIKSESKFDLLDGRNSSIPSIPSVQYPVCPRELSLRLHEVIQSRLEERIMELTTALQNSQGKVKWPKSDSSNDNTRTASAADDSPVTPQEQQFVASNYSSGDQELPESDDDIPRRSERSPRQEIFYQCKQDYIPVLNCRSNGYMEHHLGSAGYSEMGFGRGKEETHEIPSDVLCGCRSESEDGDDEMEKLLIRQIVEKARQGSPVFFKAHEALLLTD